MKNNFTPTGDPTKLIVNGEVKYYNRAQLRSIKTKERQPKPDNKKPKYPSHMTNNQRMKMRELNRMKAFEANNG